MSREQFIQNTKPLVAEPPSPTWGEAMNCGAFPTFEQNQGGGSLPLHPKWLGINMFPLFPTKKTSDTFDRTPPWV